MYNKKLRTVMCSLLVSTCITSCAALTPDRWSRDDIQKLQGTWQTDGFGYAIELNREHLTLNNVTSQGCYEEDVSLQELAYELPFVRYASDDNTVQVGDGQRYGFHFTLHPAPAMQTLCGNQLRDTPTDVVKAVSGTMQDYYPFFELHDIRDWSERTQTAIEAVSLDGSDETLFNALNTLLAGFEDSHLGLQATLDGETRRTSQRVVRDLDPEVRAMFESENTDISFARFRRNVVQQMRSDAHAALFNAPDGEQLGTAANGHIVWGRRGDVGYLSIHQFILYGDGIDIQQDIAIAADAMDQVLKDLADTSSLVIDVSLARGGFAGVAFEIASRFIPPSFKPARMSEQLPDTEASQPSILTHQRQVYASKQRDWEDVFLTANSRTRYNGQVTVVTSAVTTSAAEEFTLAMSAIPGVKTIGTATNGSFSDMLEKSLPNGWSLALSHQVYRDPEGNVVEGRGVMPDTTLELFEPIHQYPQHLLSILRLASH